MNTKERLDNMINGLHNAVAESYEKGYSDASREILGEAIHALEIRLSQAGDNIAPGLESAIAIVKNFIA